MSHNRNLFWLCLSEKDCASGLCLSEGLGLSAIFFFFSSLFPLMDISPKGCFSWSFMSLYCNVATVNSVGSFTAVEYFY